MLRWVITWVMAVAMSLPSNAREQIRVVGSSTVYPFITIAAEDFGRRTTYKTPIIESTGTGGGFKLFCSGVGPAYPDFANASRAIKSSELEKCAAKNIKNPIEIKLGYDGIVLSNSIRAKRINITKEQLFLALAKQIPQQGTLITNPYKSWNEIDSTLPALTIKVYGPPPSSGTRDAFVELVMHEVCLKHPAFVATYAEESARKQACSMLREDGAYIDAGENDNLILQKLSVDPGSFGLFGYSSLEENKDKVQGSLIKGVEPDFNNIASGRYSIARPLFIYAKREHAKSIPGLREFVRFLMQDDMIGNEGVLAMKGLIPLGQEERSVVKETLKQWDSHD